MRRWLRTSKLGEFCFSLQCFHQIPRLHWAIQIREILRGTKISADGCRIVVRLERYGGTDGSWEVRRDDARGIQTCSYLNRPYVDSELNLLLKCNRKSVISTPGQDC